MFHLPLMTSLFNEPRASIYHIGLANVAFFGPADCVSYCVYIYLYIYIQRFLLLHYIFILSSSDLTLRFDMVWSLGKQFMFRTFSKICRGKSSEKLTAKSGVI